MQFHQTDFSLSLKIMLCPIQLMVFCYIKRTIYGSISGNIRIHLSDGRTHQFPVFEIASYKENKKYLNLISLAAHNQITELEPGIWLA